MALYINENDYPQNYDWLSQEKQQAIIDMLNENRESSWRLYRMARSKDFQKHADFLERQWHTRLDRENAMVDLLDAIGVKIEYDWIGHRGTYFLATYDDALAQQEYYDDIVLDADGDVDQYRIGGDY